MKRKASALLLVAAVAVGAAPAPSTIASQSGAHAKPQSFAATLSGRPTIDGPNAWRAIERSKAWAALAAARPETRQSTRWDYARSLIAGERGNEAVGVLDVMRQDDPDLALVPSWRLARGAALSQAGRAEEALAMLGTPPLATNPEGCSWRMLAMADAGFGNPALAQLGCALPALAARRAEARARFVSAASRAAIVAGKPALGLKWLHALPDGDPAANLIRGKAHFMLGETQAGRLRLERVRAKGTAEQRVDAELTGLEAGVAGGTLPAPDAIKRLDRLRLAWRGDPIEERALRLQWRLSTKAGDAKSAMAAGATLFRYFDLGADTAPMMAGIREYFDAALAPGSDMPLSEAAGLYWDYRDLAPAGPQGDRLVDRLADRLQAEGLYGRAAELLQYQLTARAEDIARGPLSVKVASLHILSGRPDRALKALRETDGIAYPDEMLWDRRRVGAAALQLMGRTAEALSVLQDVPNGRRIAAEIQWKAQDWASLVDTAGPLLPGPGSLSEVGQAIVLRHAIALAMLGREDGLARLRARYGAGFADTRAASAFDMMTRAAGSIDAGSVARAMAALPSVSPAGAIGDLLDVEMVGKKEG